MRRYKVAFGENPFDLKIVYVNAENHTEAETIVMDKFNVFRGMIYMTAWVDREVAL